MTVKHFEYADEWISEKEIMIAVPSMVIGTGVLTLPKDLAAETMAADGWVSIVIGGILAIMLTWVIAKLAVSFPHQTFMTYASKIVTRPVATILTFIFAVFALHIAAFQVRQIADISKQYLFERTPVEVIALSFFLVVIYAVSGSRVGLFRLNTMFLPLILIIASVVLLFNFRGFKIENLLPIFQTDLSGYAKGIGTSITSYMGFGILWFYISLVKQPKKVPKMAMIGMGIPVGLYALLFIIGIGVFGNAVTSNLLYPTVELAKEVQLPGEFFERFESLFFVIWIMAIFNTTAMALDIAVFAMTSILKKMSKMKIIFILSPIVYAIAMLPQDFTDVARFGAILGYTAVSYTVCVAILLIVLAKIRGVKRVD